MIRYRRELWKVIEELGRGDIAEIGVAEGYFSADMLSWPLSWRPCVHMVDRWRSVASQRGDASNPQSWHDKNLQEARKRVEKYGDRAIFQQGDSIEIARIAPRNFCLVYIDGDHSYEGVMADIYAWFPRLLPGGVMAFHDYENTSYGVKRAVEEYFGPKRSSLPLFEIKLLPEDKPEDAGAYIKLC